MCNVIGVRSLPDCIDGSVVREIAIDVPLNEDIVRQLADGEILDYYPDFPRPYFRIRRHGALVIQGVIGKSTFRVTFDHSACMEAETFRITQVLGSTTPWVQSSCSITHSPTNEAVCP